MAKREFEVGDNLTLIIIIIVIVLASILTSCEGEQLYCGEVVDRYRTTAGYKVHEEKHIVFYSEEVGRNVDVKVTDNCYANTFVDERVCFSLLKWETE